jgi:hypothetical protein
VSEHQLFFQAAEAIEPLPMQMRLTVNQLIGFYFKNMVQQLQR